MIVAVTGINATDNPGPGVAVARSLKEADGDFKIVGLSYDLNDPGNYLDFLFDFNMIIPFPSLGWSGIKNALIKLKNNFGLDAIIPCLDAELPLFIEYQQELKDIGIQLLLPSNEQFELRDKLHLSDFSKHMGLLYPKTLAITDLNEIKAKMEQGNLDFPVVVKGRYYKAYIVHSLEQAQLKFTEIAQEWGVPILIQQVVQGEELNVIGVGDGKGGHIGILPIKKLTTTAIGKIWSGVTLNHPDLIAMTEQFLAKTKWQGPFELECMFNKEESFLIEINPRFPAWVYFATGCGINLPERLLKFINGETVPKDKEIPVGKYFVRYTYEVVTDIADMGKIQTNSLRFNK